MAALATREYWDARYELDKWSTGLERADQKLQRLQFDLANVQPREMRNDPDGSKSRNAARAQRTRLINEAIALLNKYGEVLDPNEQNRVQLELMRTQIENEKRLERTRRAARALLSRTAAPACVRLGRPHLHRLTLACNLGRPHLKSSQSQSL